MTVLVHGGRLGGLLHDLHPHAAAALVELDHQGEAELGCGAVGHTVEVQVELGRRHIADVSYLFAVTVCGLPIGDFQAVQGIGRTVEPGAGPAAARAAGEAVLR